MSEPLGVEPKKPLEGNWECLGTSPIAQGIGYQSILGIRVISSVHLIEGRREYHISVSDSGKRCKAWQAEQVLKQFGASDFTEDNHGPFKIIRSFWRPVDGPSEKCKCEDEKPEIDGDYIWREAKS